MVSKLTDSEKLTLASAAYVTSSYSQIEDGETLRDYYNGRDNNNKLNSCIDNYYKTDAEKDAILNYEIVDARDHDGPGETGFYGAVIKSDEHHYTLSFRGSNDSFSLVPGSEGYEEWVKNDIALLNDTGTLEQQQDAAAFAVEEMIKIKSMDPDAKFSFVGHSLGGQLSFFAAIYVAENYPEMLDDLLETVNLDGPGYSLEFLREHEGAIRLLYERGLLEHWQWSVVGDLLYPLDYLIKDENADSNRKTLAAEKDGTDDEVTGIGDRHNGIANMQMKDGHVVEGKKDSAAQLCGDLSRKIDLLTGGNWLLGLVMTLAFVEAMYILFPTATLLMLAIAVDKVFPGLGPVVFIAGVLMPNLLIVVITTVVIVVVGMYVLDKLGEIASAIWKALTEKKLNGNYQVSFGYLVEMSSNLDGIGTQINNIAGSAVGVFESLEYESAAGNRAKKKIASTLIHLVDISNKISDMGNQMLQIRDYYKNGDHEAGDKFYFPVKAN